MRFTLLPALLLSLVVITTAHSQEHLPPPVIEGVPPIVEGAPPIIEGQVLPPIAGPHGVPAHSGCGAPGCDGGCAQCGRTLHREKIYLIEEQEATTQHKLEIREQVVAIQTENQLKIDFHKEKRFVTELKLEPYEVTQEVIASKVVEETDYDCHGNPIKKFVTVPCVRQVKLTKYHQVPVTREVEVTVPCLRCVPRQVMVKKCVALPIEVAAIRRTLRGVPIHNTIDVPACPPSFVHSISPIIEPIPVGEPIPMNPMGEPLPVQPTPMGETPTLLPELGS